MKRTLLMLCAASALPQVAEAQTAAAGNQAVLEEIVVTAERREANLQEVPLSVTALSAQRMETSGIDAASDLPLVTPGFSMSTVSTAASPRIRGVGTQIAAGGNENAVATYIDGIYIGSAPATSILGFNNVDQVAILKGPQGTLFGRNATGGVIQISTREPSQDFGGRASLSYGNRDALAANLYVTGGLGEHAAASLALLYQDQNKGFGVNRFNGQDVNAAETFGARARMRMDLGADTTVRLGADYSEAETSNPAFRLKPGSLGLGGIPFVGGDFDANSDVQPLSEREQWGVNATIDHDFGPVRLKSITAYRESDFRSRFESDMLPIRGLSGDGGTEDEQFTQELQLQSPQDGRFRWTVGAYYYDSTTKTDFAIDGASFFDFVNGLVSQQGTESIAAFGQGTYDLTERLSLTLGVRYTDETKEFSGRGATFVPSFGATFPLGPVSGERSWSVWTYRAALDYQITDDALVYVSFNRGFKSGGFDPFSVVVPNSVEPEELDAYEIGFKSEWFGRRLRANGAAYYYDYQNLQLNSFAGGLPIITNGETAKVKGFELELTAVPTDNLTLTAGLALSDSEFGNFLIVPTVAIPGGGVTLGAPVSAKGNTIPYSPDWTLSFGFVYEISVGSGRIDLSGDYFHSDGWYAAEDNRLKQKPYDVFNASATWHPESEGSVFLRLWGKNLGNELYASQMSSQVPFSDFIAPSPGRTYGVTVGLDF